MKSRFHSTPIRAEQESITRSACFPTVLWPRDSELAIQVGGGPQVDWRKALAISEIPRAAVGEGVIGPAGAASFRSDNTVERQFEVIDPTVFEANWIPIGRDLKLEQVLLCRLKKCM